MTLRDLDPRDRHRLLQSTAAGLLAWALLLTALALIPPVRKPPVITEFPPVHLTLSSPVPAAPKTTAAAAQTPPVSEAAPTAAAPAKPAAAAKAAGSAKGPVPAKPKNAPKAPAPSAAASSGLGIPDFASPVTSSRVDEGSAEYLDFSSPRPTEKPLASSVPAGGSPVSEFSGSAAALTPSGGGASVSSRSKPAAGGSASADTEAALRSLNQAASAQDGSAQPSPSQGSENLSSGTAAASVPSTTAGRTSSVAGLSFDGTPRRLISPENPRIVLPERLARLVKSDAAVTVQFTVRKDGSVPGTLVTFTPLALLPPEIRDWLRSEFASWRFEVGNQDGQARFTYSIKME